MTRAVPGWVYFALYAGAMICLGGLAAQFRRWLDLPDPPSLAPARQAPAAGVVYAFGRGMDPRHKESAARHWPTYAAGVLYHVAIGCSVTTLLASLVFSAAPAPVRAALLIVIGLGLLGGLGIQVKRARQPVLRAFSTLDDFAANALVDIFLFAAWLALLRPAALSALYLAAALVLAYLPAGKMRHALFFFLARYYFGVFFGRRGVLPPAPGGDAVLRAGGGRRGR